MTEPKDREERAILEALAVLEADDPDEALPRLAREEAADGEDAEEVLRRLCLETVGLVALSEEPVAPPAGAKDRLMAAIAAQREARGDDPRRSAAVVPFGARDDEPGAARREEPDRASVGGAPGAVPRQARRPWLSALAAGLLVATLGLSGWLAAELHEARAALERLEHEHTRLADRLDRQNDVIQRVGTSAGLLSAVSRSGVELCPLRPVGDEPPVPGAFAVLYMPPDSKEWYLVASNMEAAPGGVYAVWLNTPDGPVPAGVLQGGPEASLRFVPPRLDERGGMVSIAVTLEPAPGLEEPSGPVVLFGDERMSVS